MIKVTGNTMKSEIANAIQKYNGAEIYSYYNAMLPFTHCYHINSNACDIKKFCDLVEENIREKVNENDDLPLNMIVIYTNISNTLDIGRLSAFLEKLEEVEKLVVTAVLMTK